VCCDFDALKPPKIDRVSPPNRSTAPWNRARTTPKRRQSRLPGPPESQHCTLEPRPPGTFPQGLRSLERFLLSVLFKKDFFVPFFLADFSTRTRSLEKFRRPLQMTTKPPHPKQNHGREKCRSSKITPRKIIVQGVRVVSPTVQSKVIFPTSHDSQK
jgi:hypothetical protein